MFLGFVRIKLSDREQLWSNSNGLKFLFEIGTISDGAMLGIPESGTPTKTSLLALALFSTLLVLKGGWEGGREVRQAEGFEAHHGDLVLELAKVST